MTKVLAPDGRISVLSGYGLPADPGLRGPITKNNIIRGTSMKTIQTLRLAAAGAALGLFAPLAQSASVFVSPANASVNLADGQATLELFMDFTGNPTIGGGVDFTVSGAGRLLAFTPSEWFDTVPDPFFSGAGSAQADGDLEVHFGSFFGLSGLNKVGDLTIELREIGDISVAISINSFFGDFFPTAGFEPQQVDLSGANLTVVPVPAAVWLFLSGLGVLAGFRRRAQAA